MKRETRKAVKRVEAVACSTIGDAVLDLPLRPNDLRRVVDHIDATDAEVKRLRKALRRIAAIPASVGRSYFPPSHAMVVRGMREHAEAALKPRKAKHHG